MVTWWSVLSLLAVAVLTVDGYTVQTVRVVDSSHDRIRFELITPRIDQRTYRFSQDQRRHPRDRFYRSERASQAVPPIARVFSLDSEPASDSIPAFIQSDSIPVTVTSTVEPSTQTPTSEPVVDEHRARASGVVQAEMPPLPQPSIDSPIERLDSEDVRMGDHNTYLNTNSIQEEEGVLRYVKRTTMRVVTYRPIRTTTPIAVIESPNSRSRLANRSNVPAGNKASSTIPSGQMSSPREVPPAVGAVGSLVVDEPGSSLTKTRTIQPDVLARRQNVPANTNSQNLGVYRPISQSAQSQQFQSPYPAGNLTSQPNTAPRQLSFTQFVVYPAQSQANRAVSGPNSGVLPVPSNGFQPQPGMTAVQTPAGMVLVQQQQQQSPYGNPAVQQNNPSPNDDTLGCTFDFATNSCKDVFNLNWCKTCHDFGNIFIHDCKCLVKNPALPKNVRTF